MRCGGAGLLTPDPPVLRARGLTQGGADKDGKGAPEAPNLAPRPWGSLGQKPTEHRGERALGEFVLKLWAIFFPRLHPEPISLRSETAVKLCSRA